MTSAISAGGSKKVEMDKASFQFNFFKSEESEMESEAASGISERKELDSFEWIVPVETIEKIKTTADLESEQVLCLFKRKYSSILHDLKGSSESELTKITEDSDVIPNQYEGGLKTWECSIDLLHFLTEEHGPVASRVLEIGCGSGLPGIFCYNQFIQSNSLADRLFVFQDFNQNVLETVTLPNILLNAPDANLDHLKFIYGDWNGLIRKLPKKSFDLILTSETIYRTESYEILLKIFSHSLKTAPEARILLAAKDYYFGLGGSVNQFINVAVAKGWNVQVLKHFTEGVPRSILQLKRQ